MNTQFLSAKLTNLASQGPWSQIYEYSPQESQSAQNKGSVFVIISRHTNPDTEEIKDIKHLLDRFVNSFYSSAQTPFSALGLSFPALASGVNNQGDTQIAVLINTGQVVYVVAVGDFAAYLFRSSTMFNIFDSSKTSGRILSGEIKPQDKILLITKNFLELVPSGVIRASLQSPEIEKAAENLAPFLEQNPQVANAALLLFLDVRPTQKAVEVGGQQKNLLISFIDRLINVLPKKTIAIGPQHEFRVTKRRKLTALVGVGLLALLLISIVLGSSRKEFLDQQNYYKEQVTLARNNLEQARSIKDLSSERARQLLLEAYDIASNLEENEQNKVDLTALRQSIDQSLGEVAGLYKPQVNLYLDLSLVSSGFEAGKVDLSDENLLILDKDGERLVHIQLDSKKTEIAAGPSLLQNATDVAAYVNREYVLQSEGINQISGENLRVVIPKDWDGQVLIKAFAGNMYILEKAANQIWRYSGNEGVFATKTAWLAQDQNVTLSDSTNWMVDGSIWVLDESGALSKYINGKYDSFSLSGYSGQFDNFYTDASSQYLYLLDKSKNKVVVFDKKGKFFGEYEIEEAGEADKIVVSEQDKKMLLFVKSRVYAVELTHL